MAKEKVIFEADDRGVSRAYVKQRKAQAEVAKGAKKVSRETRKAGQAAKTTGTTAAGSFGGMVTSLVGPMGVAAAIGAVISSIQKMQQEAKSAAQLMQEYFTELAGAMAGAGMAVHLDEFNTFLKDLASVKEGVKYSDLVKQIETFTAAMPVVTSDAPLLKEYMLLLSEAPQAGFVRQSDQELLTKMLATVAKADVDDELTPRQERDAATYVLQRAGANAPKVVSARAAKQVQKLSDQVGYENALPFIMGAFESGQTDIGEQVSRKMAEPLPDAIRRKMTEGKELTSAEQAKAFVASSSSEEAFSRLLKDPEFAKNLLGTDYQSFKTAIKGGEMLGSVEELKAGLVASREGVGAFERSRQDFRSGQGASRLMAMRGQQAETELETIEFGERHGVREAMKEKMRRRAARSGIPLAPWAFEAQAGAMDAFGVDYTSNDLEPYLPKDSLASGVASLPMWSALLQYLQGSAESTDRLTKEIKEDRAEARRNSRRPRATVSAEDRD